MPEPYLERPAEEEPRLNKQQMAFLRAVAKHGTIAAGARAAKVSWSTAKRWIQSEPAFRQRFEEAKSFFQDSLRQRLIKKAEQLLKSPKTNGATLRFVAKGELLGEFDQAWEKRGPKPRDYEAILREIRQEALKHLEEHGKSARGRRPKEQREHTPASRAEGEAPPA